MTPELLLYAKQQEERGGTSDEQVLPDSSPEEVQHLIGIAKERSAHRLKWFKSAEGTKLRLLYGMFVFNCDSTNSSSYRRKKQGLHNPIALQKSNWCILCRCEKSDSTAYSGHRTRTKCITCNVPLCHRVHPPARKSCWVVFHERKNIERRVLTRPSPSPATPSSSQPERVLPQRRSLENSQDPSQQRRFRSRRE